MPFISGWHLSDHCEIWLEALTRTGQELRLQCASLSTSRAGARAVRPEKMVPGGPPASSLPGRKKQLAQWRNVVASLEVITL
ncbi:MerR family transcriptional regulator [Salmonella enterica subsp. enterica]|uniref:MerR family transcriptional regulator n=1 Tax=Salmonella enterica I TaxID=59201 RepID=A0A447U3Z7_SALET|nr:MerR family transcriptional regulator [Salmonella enterica subsp. enterica]